jgi:putative endonuclease
MKREKNYYIYISTNHPRHTVLYTGVTNNLLNRDDQHKKKISKKSFTAKYNVNKVVYIETFTDVNAAIIREKQIKRLVRRKKIELIESINPEWKDLVEELWK